MKKIIFLIMLTSMKVSFIFGQEAKLNLQKNLTIENTQLIELYICNRANNDCYDQKDPSIIEGKKLSACFKLIKSLTKDDCKKLIMILNSGDTYDVEKYDCFTTDYAIILYGTNHTISGYVNFSFVCNRLYSYPTIEKRKSLLPNKTYLVGFSKKGRKKLLNLLGLSEAKISKG